LYLLFFSLADIDNKKLPVLHVILAALILRALWIYFYFLLINQFL